MDTWTHLERSRKIKQQTLKWRFFSTRDVEKFKRFIVDQMDET